jgi:hypothetical protein
MMLAQVEGKPHFGIMQSFISAGSRRIAFHDQPTAGAAMRHFHRRKLLISPPFKWSIRTAVYLNHVWRSIQIIIILRHGKVSKGST